MKKSTFLAVVFLLKISAIHQLFAAQLTDIFDNSTHDGSALLTLDDKHTYRPTNAAAWSGAVTLPSAAVVTIGASSVTGFGGNTYTVFTAEAGGKITLYGADGHAEVMTSFVKSSKGNLVIEDRTSGGLTVSSFTANTDAAVSDITINTFGAGTTLNLSADMVPVGAAKPLTLNIDISAVTTLTTITSIPTLTGSGRLILGASLTVIPLAESPRLAAFKGKITTHSGGTTDITFSAESYIWELSGSSTVSYAIIKLMKGTVRLPASTIIEF